MAEIGQLGAAPYVPCDLGQPDARLYRVDERTRALTPITREAWRFAREAKAEGDAAPEVIADGSHVWLRDGFTPGALYLLVFRAEGAPVVGCGLLAVRDAAEWLRDGPFGAHARVLGFGVSQTGRFLRQFLHEGLNLGAQGGRRFLVKQGHASAICEMDLAGLDDFVTVLSATTDNVALLDSVRERHGDDPFQWLPVLLREVQDRKIRNLKGSA